MSNRGTDWARTRRFGSVARKAIAYVLGDHHNGETGRLDPSVDTIARETDLSARAVQINLREMERLGAVMTLRTPGRRCCSYVINWDWRGIDGRATTGHRPRANPAYDCADAPPNPAPDSPKPEREDLTGEKEDARTRATFSLSKISPTPKEARRIEGVRPRPPRLPFPDEDPELKPEELAEIRRAGHDPSELTDEARDWANETGAISDDWPRVLVHFARRTPPKKRRAAARSGPRVQRSTATHNVIAAYLEARAGGAP